MYVAAALATTCCHTATIFSNSHTNNDLGASADLSTCSDTDFVDLALDRLRATSAQDLHPCDEVLALTTSFMHTTIELRSSDESETTREERMLPPAGNEEVIYTTEFIMEEVVSTVGAFWGRGEGVAQTIAHLLVQRGAQMGDENNHPSIHYQLAELMRPYTVHQPVVCEIPNRARLVRDHQVGGLGNSQATYRKEGLVFDT